MITDFDTIRNYVRKAIPCSRFLTKSALGLYICPFCGSGRKEHQSGGLKYYPDTNTWHCFSCGRSGDVIDLFEAQEGCGYRQAVLSLGAELGFSADGDRNKAVKSPATSFLDPGGINTPLKDKTPFTGQSGGIQARPDFRDYYQACQIRLRNPAAVQYLQQRCISFVTAYRHGCGFDPAADPASAPGGEGQLKQPAARLIIPTCRSHYVAVAIDSRVDPAYKKLNPRGCAPGIFNPAALYRPGASSVFVTEGPFDALSVLEMGGSAVALCSTSNKKLLFRTLQKNPTEATLILSLDNDEAGRQAQEWLADNLRQARIPFIAVNISGNFKDENEALIADKKEFEAAVLSARQLAAESRRSHGH